MSVPRQIFLFFLVKPSTGASYFVQNGTIHSRPASSPIWLQDDPYDWMNISVAFGRNTTYHAVNRAFVPPLTFPGDGAQIIRHLFWTKKGVEQELGFIALKWNDQTGIFEEYCKVGVDLSKIEDDPASGVTVKILELGPLQYLKSNENKTYEIPCDGSIPENKRVLIQGIKFQDTFNYSTLDLEIQDDVYTIPLAFMNNEGDSVNVTRGDQQYEQFSHIPTYVAQSANYLFKAYVGTTVTLTGSLIIQNLSSSSNFITISWWKNTGVFQNIFTGTIGPGSHTIPVNHPVSLNDNESLFLVLAQVAATQVNIKWGQNTISLSFSSQYQDTEAYVIRPADLFRLLVEKVTEGKYTASSSLLQAYEHLSVTSGMALRRMEKAVVKWSLADFFMTYNALLNGALGSKKVSTGLGEELFFESKSTVYDKSVVTLDIGEVSDLKITVSQEHFFNEVEFGYPEQKYDEKQGQLEYNTTLKMSAPVTRVAKKYSQISKARADSYGIEYTRYLSPGNQTANNKSDNDVFLLAIEGPAEPYTLLREQYDTISGLVNPETAYNIKDLTSKRMLLKHGNYIRGVLHNLTNEYLTGATLDKNRNLATVKGSEIIIESANVPIGYLPDPLFYPYEIRFKTKVPLTFEQVMNSSANGHIRLKYNGVTLYGFPEEVSVKPALNDAQEWKLLMSPLTNLADLENLDADGINLFTTMGYSIFIPHLCPVKMVRLGQTLPAQYHFRHMDDWWHSEQIQIYTEQREYAAPWQTNDLIEFQLQTNGLGPVQVELLDSAGQTISTVQFNTVSDPSIILPQILYEASVSLTGLVEGYYYLLITAGTGTDIVQAISEPLHVKDDHEDTLYYEYRNSRNKQSCVFTSGYRPGFRVGGWIDEFEPGGTFVTYINQPADIEMQNGIPFRSCQLNIGPEVPPWVADKVNRIMLLNDVTIDGKSFTRDGDAKIEKQGTPGTDLKLYTLKIRESENRDGISLSTDGQPGTAFTVVYNINTSAFGNGAGSGNSVVQVTETDHN